MPVSAHRSPPLRASNIPDHLADETLLGRLFRREATQQAQQPRFGGGVRLDFGLMVDFEQEEAQVAAAAALARLQQKLGALRQNVGGGIPVGLLDVARADDAQLLVRFVELAFFDPGGRRGEWSAKD